MKKILILPVFAFIVVLFASSCQTNPYTGRSQLMLVSSDEEKQIGEQAWRDVCAQYPASSNKNLSDSVMRVGKNIAAVAGRPDYRWEFRLLESEEANAFCLPGGKVAVFSGLFSYLDNEAELAAVVGHEIGHAVSRHGAERMSQSLVQQTGAKILQLSLGGTNSSYDEAWLIAYAGISNLGIILPYSRTQEYEADKIGLLLMAKAGYDPEAALDFWKKFSSISKESKIAEFFSTHPMSSKRMEEMEKIMPEAKQEYNRAKTRLGYGLKY